MLDAAALRNTLIVRTDRIGDVLLTLPMAGALKQCVPEARVTFLVREYTRPLLEGHPHVDEVLSLEREQDLASILPTIRERNFSAVFCPSPSLPIAQAMKRAEIPVRVGTAYRGYASLFTHRIAEHRKYAERHEAQFNIRMIDRDLEPTPAKFPSTLHLSEQAQTTALRWLAERRIGDHEKFAIVHPGSGGSARDYPPELFARLVARIDQELHVRTVLTGLDSEIPLLRHVEAMAGVECTQAVGLPLDTLAAVIANARCLVTNSTGVLHIAAAVGTFAVGVYPPVLACSPQRWGPWTSHAAVFEPNVDEACGDCASPSCVHFDCMRMVPTEQLMDAVRPQFREESVQ